MRWHPTMKRRDFLRSVGTAALAPGVFATGCVSRENASVSAGTESGIAPLWPGYDRAIVIDGLASPLQFNIPQGGLPLTATDLERLRDSGITAVNLTVSIVGSKADRPFEGTLERISAWEREIDTHPTKLMRVRNLRDIQEAKATGRLGLIYGFQDTVPLAGDLDRIGLFAGLGVRVVQLTYNDQNRVGAGSLVDLDEGLTDFGRAAVERLNEARMVIDLSHCGSRTTLEGIRASSAPTAITHAGCNTVFEHPRNKDDEALRLLAERGGVLGIYLMPFLNPEGPATFDDVMAHLDHALDVCGEDHVGIGSDQGIVPLDMGGDFMAQFAAVSSRRQAAGIAAPREDTPPLVPELNHARRMDAIADRMGASGHSSTTIEKVLGGNFFRFFEEVWG